MPQKHQSACDEGFIQLCKRQLSDLVGLIAPLLVQRILIASPQIFKEEFVETLATKIPDVQEAVILRHRLLS